MLEMTYIARVARFICVVAMQYLFARAIKHFDVATQHEHTILYVAVFSLVCRSSCTVLGIET